MYNDRIIDYFAEESRAKSSAQERLKSADALREQYRSLKNTAEEKFLSEQERNLYGITRLPGTLAALRKVFGFLRAEQNFTPPKTILDCGSGPGTALFASIEAFGTDLRFCAVEKDPGFISISQKALAALWPEMSSQVQWQQAKFPGIKPTETYDLSILSYVLSETPSEKVPELINSLLEYSSGFVVIVDSGSPKVYEQVMQARDVAIANKSFSILAPCPHALPCPMRGKDFCHFPARFVRHPDSKSLKRASAQAEDEKFSYLILKKQEQKDSNFIPIIRRVQHRKGHRNFDICDKSAVLKRIIVSKKYGNIYHNSAKLDWADNFYEIMHKIT
jgi:ribosomal protein RSM22 (predicted rRNA methylase)